MLILETKDALFKQLQDAWGIIAQADEALETALTAVRTAHENLRKFSRGANDEGTVPTATRVAATGAMDTRKATKTTSVFRLSAKSS